MIDIAAERRAMFEHDKTVRRNARDYPDTQDGLARVESDLRFWLERIEYGRQSGLDSALICDWVYEASLCDAIRDDIMAELADSERRVA